MLFYTPGEVAIPLRAGYDVTVVSDTEFPRAGAVTLTVRAPRPARFPVFLRVPAWTARFNVDVNGEKSGGEPGRFVRLERMWRSGDRIRIDMDITTRVTPGGASYPDFVAVERGPQVLALETSLNPQVPYPHRAALKSADAAQIRLAAVIPPQDWPGRDAWSTDSATASKPPLVLVPFADAVNYRVWLLAAGPSPGRRRCAATAFGIETWSRQGSVPGSICDERPDTYRTTFEGKPAREDWYAVQMEKPAVIARVVYRHGKVFENGGWFDSSASKPRIQVKRPGVDQWEDVGELASYPALGSSQVPGMRDGEPFTLKLKQPVRAIAVRITGRPGRSFSTCSELSAYTQ